MTQAKTLTRYAFATTLAVTAGCGSPRSVAESTARVIEAASTAGQYAYGFDPSGMVTSVGSGQSSYTIVRTGPAMTAGSDTYTYDALGRVSAIDDMAIAYGPDGQIDHATKGGRTASYLYDENGQRILKSVDGTPQAAYVDGRTITATELDEPVRVGGRVVGLLRNGAFTLAATDVRGTVEADTHGAQKLASPFGARPVHPDIAQALDYAGTGFDGDLGTDRMGVRDYDARIARFLQPDPLFLLKPESCVKSPTECNLYGYARDRPAEFVDATGTCAAPALSQGQVGVCIEAFIASAHLGGIGLGDNRTFAANDPSKTQRVQFQLVFDKDGKFVSQSVFTAHSDVLVHGFGLQGTTYLHEGRPWVDSDGGTNYDIGFRAWNGFANLPGPQPHVPILLRMGLRVLPGGEVQLNGGERSGFPSFGMYSYHLDDHGKVQSTTIFEAKEHEVSDLGHWGFEVPSTRR